MSSNEINEDFILDKYILQNMIGSGSFGKVYKVQEKDTGKIYAAKIFSKTNEDNYSEIIRNISREISIISKLNHPSVIKYICYSPYNFKKKPKPVIITEYASNGTLEELIDLQKKNSSISNLNDTRKLIIIYGIASAISYLHSHDIIHRDLKPANILLDDFLFPKIADFGLSKINDQNINNFFSETTIGTIKGTPKYISPEIWQNYEYSKASDVYAFAFIVYEIMLEEKVFENIHIFGLLMKIKSGYRPKFNKRIPPSYRKLIKECWSQDPLKRPTFDQILEKLKNDRGFITESINENDYLNYINYIKDQNISFDFSRKAVILYNIFGSNQNQLRIDYNIKLYPLREFLKLTNECKNMIIDAEKDPEKQFFVGRCLFEGREYFPINTQLGIKYLMLSIRNNNIDSLVYYCKQLIKGQYIPMNHKKAKKLIQKYLVNDEGLYNLLYGIMYKRMKDFSKAKFYFRKSIESGNVESMYEYAKMLFRGKGFFVDKEEARKFFQKAIEKSCLKAMHFYGIILMNDENPKNIKKGINLIVKAANEEYSKSQFVCYMMFDIGYQFIDKDDQKSIEYLEKAAKQGHVVSMYKYALYLKTNKKDDEMKNEIIRLFKNASDRGLIDSIYQYGILNNDGHYLPPNPKQAARFFKISADNGNDDSMNQYGTMLIKGDGVDENNDEAIKYFKMAIEKRNPISMFIFASMLHNGNGIAINQSEAVKYYKMSIEKGYDPAMHQYACMLEKGDGIPVNYEGAAKYYKMAIEKGNDESMVNYALMLEHGKGVPFDYEEAIRYYKIAMEKGNLDAICCIAYLKRNGYYFKVDKEESFRYFKMAADKGSDIAMIKCGEMIENGEVDKNGKEDPSYYYKMAIDKGNDTAMMKYGDMLDHEEAIKYYQMANNKGNKLGKVFYYLLSIEQSRFVKFCVKYEDYIFLLRIFLFILFVYKYMKNGSKFYLYLIINYLYAFYTYAKKKFQKIPQKIEKEEEDDDEETDTDDELMNLIN